MISFIFTTNDGWKHAKHIEHPSMCDLEEKKEKFQIIMLTFGMHICTKSRTLISSCNRSQGGELIFYLFWGAKTINNNFLLCLVPLKWLLSKWHKDPLSPFVCLDIDFKWSFTLLPSVYMTRKQWIYRVINGTINHYLEIGRNSHIWWCTLEAAEISTKIEVV